MDSCDSESLGEGECQIIRPGCQEHFCVLNGQTRVWREGDKLFNDGVFYRKKWISNLLQKALCGRCNAGNATQLII